MVIIMNKNEFIKELSKVTKYKESDCVIINDILENNFFISKKSKDKIISEIVNQLNVNIDEATNIYNAAKNIINNQIKEKIKHPFGN